MFSSWGETVIFGYVPCEFGSSSIFPAAAVSSLSAGLFPLAWWLRFHFEISGFSVFNQISAWFFVCLGFLVFVLSIFLWLYAGKYQTLYRDFVIRMTVEGTYASSFWKMKALPGKTGLKFMLLHCWAKQVPEVHDNVDMYYPVSAPYWLLPAKPCK